MTSKKIDDQPSDAEIAQAKKEGVLDKVRESATTQGLGEPAAEPVEPARVWNLGGTNQVEHLTDLGLDALKAAIDPKKDGALSEEVIGKLLILERNGKNRTDFVKLYMDRLKVKDVMAEVPEAGGPDYTNDVTAVSKL